MNEFEGWLVPYNFDTAAHGVAHTVLVHDATDRWYQGEVINLDNEYSWCVKYTGVGVRLQEHIRTELWEKICTAPRAALASAWGRVLPDHLLEVYEWPTYPIPFMPLEEDRYF